MPDGRRVLVAEDDTTIREVLVEALSDDGYEVMAAANGADALRAIQTWRPALIILDVMMPDMDGHAFRARQRELRLAADVPVLVVSASRRAADHARELGAVAGIEKPFRLAELLDTVRRALDET